MSSPERAKIFMWLSDRARQRFETRRDIEWKISFGIWGFFAAGSFAIINAKDWPISYALAIALTFVAIGFIYAQIHWMWQFLSPSENNDRKNTIFWETEAGRLATSNFDTCLKELDEGPQGSMTDRKTGRNPRADQSNYVTIGVTALFGLAFMSLVWNRALAEKPTTTAMPKVTVEGTGVEIGSMKTAK